MISADTWSVVAATAIGPIAAVTISMWLEERKSARGRRHWVFSMLMGLRGASLNPDHVRALNLVQVEFYKHLRVIEAWRKFLDHLETNESKDGWQLKHRDLLNALLVEMANSLGVNNTGVDIARGGYAPVGWANRERDQEQVLKAAVEVANLLLDPAFKQTIKHLQDAELRALFLQEAQKIAMAPAPIEPSVMG